MTHSYPLTSLYGDYLRTLIGLVFLGVPFYFALGNLFMTIVFGSLTLLFVIFGVRTGIRHVITIETSPQGIASVGPLGKRIAWSDIAKIDLKYFSTSRDKKSKDGWMQMKICVGLLTVVFTHLSRAKLIHSDMEDEYIKQKFTMNRNLGLLGLSLILLIVGFN